MLFTVGCIDIDFSLMAQLLWVLSVEDQFTHKFVELTFQHIWQREEVCVMVDKEPSELLTWYTYSLGFPIGEEKLWFSLALFVAGR